MLLYIEKVKENQKAFADKVIEISKKLKINPNWLMLVMYSESGLDHRKPNPDGGATGLIQFMPETAAWLKTTTYALKNMSNVQQLDYVYKYFKGFTGKIKSYFDLYLITFFPAAVGKPNDFIFQTKTKSAALIAAKNKGIDKWVKDGKITLGEFKKYTNSTIPKDIIAKLNDNTTTTTPVVEEKKNNKLSKINPIFLFGMIGLFIYFYKKK